MNSVQRRYLTACAKKAGLNLSDYIRGLVMDRKLEKEPTLPPEVLAFKAQLHHLCGLLQPLSQRSLDGESLNALERAEIKYLSQSIADIVRQLNNYLK